MPYYERCMPLQRHAMVHRLQRHAMVHRLQRHAMVHRLKRHAMVHRLQRIYAGMCGFRVFDVECWQFKPDLQVQTFPTASHPPPTQTSVSAGAGVPAAQADDRQLAALLSHAP